MSGRLTSLIQCKVIRKMKTKLLHTLTLCLIALPCFGSTEEVEHIKERILTWSDSLRSFSGEYTIWDERISESGNKLITIKIFCRLRGEDIYLETYPDGSADHTEFSFATLNGVSTLRSNQQGASSSSGSINVPQTFEVPHGAYILPTELFGTLLGMSLRERVDAGLWNVFFEDDKILFSVRTEGLGNGIDLWFKENLELVRIDWFTWSDPSEEVMQELADFDRLRVGFVSSTFEVDKFLHQNGASFPTFVTRHDFEFLPEQLAPLYTAYKNGEISRAMLYRTRMKMASEGAMVVTRRMTLTADPAAISLNPELADDQFVLSFPEGARVGDLSTKNDLKSQAWYRSVMHWWTHESSTGYQTFRQVILGASAIGVVTASLIIYRKRSRST